MPARPARASPSSPSRFASSRESVVDSTGEIETIMTEIQGAANDLVIATEQELKQVAGGVDLAHVTGDVARSDPRDDRADHRRGQGDLRGDTAAEERDRPGGQGHARGGRGRAADGGGGHAGRGSAEQLSGIAKESSQVGAAFKIVD